MRKVAIQGTVYQTPTQEELHRAQELFRVTLSGTKQDVTSLQKAWLQLNFDLLKVHEDGDDLLVLKENDAHKTGRGFYVFRTRDTLPIALQAPHCLSALNTGPIVLRLFHESRAAASVWGTVNRRDADLAHLPESYLQSFTLAFAQTYPNGVILQLHGFSKNKRRGQEAAEADMIISGGTETPAAWLLTAVNYLKSGVRGSVKVYPYEVAELGALSNEQGKTLRQLGHDGFIHVAMSVELRKRMVKPKNVHLRRKLITCLHRNRL